MDGEQSRMISEIREAIQKGTLKESEIKRRLSRAIDMEFSKKDAPAELRLVKALQDFLWELETGGMPYVSCIETMRKVVEEKLMQREKHRTARRVILRAALVTTAVLILTVVGDGLLNQRWLQSRSSEDKQQYVIQGEVVDPGVVSKGTADANNEPSDLSTTSLQEAITFLGFQPDLPAWLPEGWEAKSYYASIGEVNIRFNVTYQSINSEMDTLFYSTKTFGDAENAYASIEQNADGEQISIGENTVYFTQNEGNVTCIFSKGLTVYTLSGTLDINDMRHIIASLEGGNTP